MKDTSQAEAADKQVTPQPSASPTKAAVNALKSAIESLPTSLAPIVNHYGRKINECRGKLDAKRHMKSRLTSDKEYIPRAAKANEFKVTLSKAAIEGNQETITLLEGQVEQAKSIFEKSLRTVIEACLDLEIDALETQEGNLIIEILFSLAEATSKYDDNNCSSHLKVVNLLKLDPALLKYAATSEAADVLTAYRDFHSLTAIPEATLKVATGPFATSDIQTGALAEAALSAQRPKNKGLQLFRKTISAILIEPQNAYLRQQEENARSIAIKKYATEIMEG